MCTQMQKVRVQNTNKDIYQGWLNSKGNKKKYTKITSITKPEESREYTTGANKKQMRRVHNATQQRIDANWGLKYKIGNQEDGTQKDN